MSITLVSILPPAFVQTLPENARQAVAIAVDIRDLAGKIAVDSGSWLGGLIGAIDGSAADRLLALIADLPVDLADWLPYPDASGPAPNGLPQVAKSFSGAKKMLYQQVYRDRRETFYCGCRYDAAGKILLSTCGLLGLRDSRAGRVEAEHVYPAAQFGNMRKCWRRPTAFPTCTSSGGRALSGRECCERVDPVFAAAHNDLYNLYPANGYINGQRSNFNWGMTGGGQRYGQCEIRIDASRRRVQPPTAVRGDIARTMLYMRDTYGFRLSRQDEKLYAAWNNADPPDDWEIERVKRIKRIQGLGNAYVEQYRLL